MRNDNKRKNQQINRIIALSLQKDQTKFEREREKVCEHTSEKEIEKERGKIPKTHLKKTK